MSAQPANIKRWSRKRPDYGCAYRKSEYQKEIALIQEQVHYFSKHPTIMPVRAGIHRIACSSSEYSKDDITQALGQFTPAFWDKKKPKTYQYKAQRFWPDGEALLNINLLYGPTTPQIASTAKIYLDIIPNKALSPAQYRDALADLHSRLPRLKVSEVEYHLDLMCRDRESAESAHRFIHRHLFIPYNSEVRIVTDKADESLYSVHYDRDTKTYTDHISEGFRKSNKATPEDALWYVRFEFTAARSSDKRNRVLRAIGIDTLPGLLRNPQVYPALKNRFAFKRFKSDKHPAPWDVADRDTFQRLYNRTKVQASNPRALKANINQGPFPWLFDMYIAAAKKFTWK